MTDLHFRPRFRFPTPLAPDEVKARIVQEVGAKRPIGLTLKATGHHLVLAFPAQVRRMWTPQMDVDIEVVDGRTWVRCLIGPAPQLWMLFMGGYILCAMIAIMGLCIGAAQQLVGTAAWGFWMVAPTPFIAVGLWALAQAGKVRSMDAMRHLKGVVDEALGCDCIALAERG